MRRRTILGRSAAFLFVFPLLVASGCSSGGDSNGGTGPAGNVDFPTAQQQVNDTGAFLSRILASVTPVANGSQTGAFLQPWVPGEFEWPGGPRCYPYCFEVTPVYNSNWWEAECAEDYPDQYTYTVGFSTQYRDSKGQPQQSSTGAVSIAFNVAYHCFYRSYDYEPIGKPDYNISYTNDYSNNTTITTTSARSGVTFDVDLSGSMTGNVDPDDGGSTNTAMNWTGNISMPYGGCPTGSLTMNIAPFVVEVTFNGTSVGTAQFYQNEEPTGEPQYVYLSCGF